ncbi:MAG: magnesium transporter, partial [Saprospirales bacterium]
VDDNMHLKGFLSLKKIIQSDPDTLLKDLYESEFVFSYVDEDREVVAAKVEKYDLVAIPVLNSQQQILGVVYHDDVIEVIRKEHTEDMEKFMGIVPGDEILNYNQTSVGGHFKKRVVWLAALAVLGLISGIIIHSFEEALTVLIILAMYIPMVADTGGNAGSQAATVVIRALALNQLAVTDWLKIVWKEARIAFLLALVLGVIAFGKVLWLSWNTVLPPEHNLYFLAFGISLALSLQVITSTVVGACLPLIVKKFGGDPAVAASPAITTTVDITGLLIYFGIAMVLFF